MDWAVTAVRSGQGLWDGLGGQAAQMGLKDERRTARSRLRLDGQEYR